MPATLAQVGCILKYLLSNHVLAEIWLMRCHDMAQISQPE